MSALVKLGIWSGSGGNNSLVKATLPYFFSNCHYLYLFRIVQFWAYTTCKVPLLSETIIMRCCCSASITSLCFYLLHWLLCWNTQAFPTELLVWLSFKAFPTTITVSLMLHSWQQKSSPCVWMADNSSNFFYVFQVYLTLESKVFFRIWKKLQFPNSNGPQDEYILLKHTFHPVMHWDHVCIVTHIHLHLPKHREHFKGTWGDLELNSATLTLVRGRDYPHGF